MSEDKKTLIDLVPDSVDNAVKNITDKPTQNIGTTFADIWYLVFGGISQAAEKRKLKYSYALQEFENELKEKIAKIPEEKVIEPDIQVIAQALEAAKYCVEKEELRNMFSNLIASSINEDNVNYVHPIFINIIKNLSTLDAKMIKALSKHYDKNILPICANDNSLLMSLSLLENQGLIYTNIQDNLDINYRELLSVFDMPGSMTPLTKSDDFSYNKIFNIQISDLGKAFILACIEPK